jgi:hypothetical protein
VDANDKMKYVLAILAFAAWGALVLLNKADPARYVDALAISVAGLGVHGATKRRVNDAASATGAAGAQVVPVAAADPAPQAVAPLSPVPQVAAPAAVQ